MARDKTVSHEKIVQAASQEFMTYGFENASMRRIAENAGLTVSALYKHFPGKEEMFASLVQPTVDLCMDGYRVSETEYFADIASLEHDQLWKQKDAIPRMMRFIYDHLDAFILIITRSNGTKYESFIHDIAAMEEASTLRYMETLRQKGFKVNEVNRKEFHLLVTAQFQAVAEAVRHDFTREEAMHYAGILERFYAEGWKQLFTE